MPKAAKWLIYLVISVLVGIFIWSQLPRGPYSTDLTRIGQGRPAIVLAYDNLSMGGMEVMAMMDELRPSYEDRVYFLVAPLGAAAGFAFGKQHDAVNGTVVLFSGSGVPVRKVNLPANVQELRKLLEGVLPQAPGPLP